MGDVKFIEIDQGMYKIWDFGEGIVGIEAIHDVPPPFPGVLVESLKRTEIPSAVLAATSTDTSSWDEK